MTETMTAEHTEQVANEGPDLNPQPPQNLPDIAGVPTDKTAFSLAVRRMLGLEDASDGEIELFFHVCHKSGLDPFNRECYMIGRNTEVGMWEPVDPAEPDGQKRKVMRWVTKYTIQTGINGFRKRAREIADAKGIEFTQDDPLWCGTDGVWKEVWTESTPPVASKFVVYRDGDRYSFIAHYSEYVQSTREGKPNSMWNKMPCNQTRKCAEAGAIQAAFPDELGGLLLEDAVQNEPVVIDETGATVEQQKPATKRRGGKGVDALADRANAKQQNEVIEGEVEQPGQGGDNDQSQGAEPSSGSTHHADSGDQADPETDAGPEKTQMRRSLEVRLFKLIDQIEPKPSRDDRLDIYRSVIGRKDIQSTDDLDDSLVAKVGDQLYSWRESGALNNKVHDILMAADAAASEQDGVK